MWNAAIVKIEKSHDVILLQTDTAADTTTCSSYVPLSTAMLVKTTR